MNAILETSLCINFPGENHVSFHIVSRQFHDTHDMCGPILGTDNLGSCLGQQTAGDTAHSLPYIWGNMSPVSGREQKEECDGTVNCREYLSVLATTILVRLRRQESRNRRITQPPLVQHRLRLKSFTSKFPTVQFCLHYWQVQRQLQL